MPLDYVSNDEILYRRVPNHPGNYKTVEGICRVSSAAFGDRYKMQPSVDRAKLRDNNPVNCKENSDDYVVSLTAGRVRQDIPNDVQRKIDNKLVACVVDVLADPIGAHCRIHQKDERPANPAHAVISAIPTFAVSEKKIFEEKFRRVLARLAQWEIAPQNLP